MNMSDLKDCAQRMVSVCLSVCLCVCVCVCVTVYMIRDSSVFLCMCTSTFPMRVNNVCVIYRSSVPFGFSEQNVLCWTKSKQVGVVLS